MSAALGWLCSVDDPLPGELRDVLDALVTDDLVRLMARVPWMWHVDAGGAGLARCVEQMTGADAADTHP